MSLPNRVSEQQIDIGQSIADRIQDKQPTTYTEEDMIGFAEWVDDNYMDFGGLWIALKGATLKKRYTTK